MQRLYVTLIYVLIAMLAAACDSGGGDGDDEDDDNGGGDEEDCDDGTEYCPGAGCVNLSNHADHCGECDNECGSNERCIMASCQEVCPAQEIDCDPSPSSLYCVDPVDNRSHCGSCDNACAEDEICDGRDCVNCDPEDTLCGNSCVDLMSNFFNCGECGNSCVGTYCECGDCVEERSDEPCPE